MNLDIQNEFNRLMQHNPQGLLTPEAIVQAAENEVSPLHQYFEWDEQVAAHSWRLQQARILIRRFEIYNEELKIRVNALTALQVDREVGGGYRWTMDILKRPDLREQLLTSAYKELENLRKKYENLQ